MTLLKVYSKLGEKGKLTLPRGVRKSLEIKPGDKVELRIVGMNKARKLIATKVRRRLAR